MKKLTALVTGLAITAAFGSSAFATDVYVVNFRNAQDVKSQQLDGQLASALAISGVSAEEVVIDTSTAAKWEKGAHDAAYMSNASVSSKTTRCPAAHNVDPGL